MLIIASHCPLFGWKELEEESNLFSLLVLGIMKNLMISHENITQTFSSSSTIDAKCLINPFIAHASHINALYQGCVLNRHVID